MKFLPKKKYRSLWENFLSLSLLQAANYLLPLITLPYLVRVLGAGKFGLVAFAMAFIQYFVYLTDYGFNLSATREISLNRDERDKVSLIFSSVYVSKAGLMLVGFLLLCGLVFGIEKFKVDWPLYLLAYGIVVGQMLFPIWFFQGMEKMKYITILNLVAKTIFTVAIFIFIRQADDYLWVPAIHGLGFISAGVISLWIVISKFNVSIIFPPFAAIRQRLREGFSLFVTNFVPNLYNNSTTFVLGLVASPELVGFYAAAFKLVEVFNGMIQLISRTFYPFLNRNFSEFFLFRNIILSAGLLLSLAAILASDLMVNVLFTDAFAVSKTLIKIIGLSPLALAIIACYGTNKLLILKQDKKYMLITSTASAVGFVTCLILVPMFQHFGASINLIFSRSLLALLCYIAARKYKESIDEYRCSQGAQER